MPKPNSSSEQRQLRFLRARLGRLIHDIGRKIAGQPQLEAVFQWPLAQIRSQQQRQRGWKLYSFHAPEVEGIGKRKAAAPYEFGVEASIVTTNARAPGGGVRAARYRAARKSVRRPHARCHYCRHRTAHRCEIERAYADKGYRGHNADKSRRVFISGQKARRVRQLQPRTAASLRY
jgi:IS5 family transposase